MTTERRFSREELSRLIERAIELERAQDGSLSENQVRDIAREIGIDSHAIEAALRMNPVHARSQPIASRRKWIDWGFSALAFAVGLATAVVRELVDVRGLHIESIVGFVGAAALAIGAFLVSRNRASARAQAFNLLTWGMFAAGFSVIVPSLADDVVGMGVAGAFVTGLLGFAWMRRGRLTEPVTTSTSGHEAESPTDSSRWLRFAVPVRADAV
jgi:hypothetical protein